MIGRAPRLGPRSETYDQIIRWLMIAGLRRTVDLVFRLAKIAAGATDFDTVPRLVYPGGRYIPARPWLLIDFIVEGISGG